MPERTPTCAESLHADLSWYDYPESAPGLDAFWTEMRDLLRAHGVDHVPEALDRSVDPRALWADPRCLLSQCCGPDLFTPPGEALLPLARPTFTDIDAPPGHYFSHIVAPDRPRAATGVVVVNAPSSRSGCLALRAWLAARGEDCPPMIVSGSHAASLEHLRAGRADLAAIDAHNWPLLDRRGVRIIGRSDAAPSPPWVSHRDCGVDPDLLREALARAIERCGRAIRIGGMETTSRQDWAGLIEAP